MRKKKILLFCFLFFMFWLSINVVGAAETLDELNACENPNIVKVVFFGKIIIDIVKIIIPLALVILGMIDFSKAMTSNDDGVQKKSLNLFVRRIVYGILIFAVPWIVKIIIINLGNLTEGVNFTDCLENAYEEKIEELQVEYDRLVEEEEAKYQKNGGSSGDSSGNTVDISGYSPSVVENLAAFSGSEVGYYSDKFWTALLFEAAVFMNNYDYQKQYSGVDINTPVTTDSMCKVLSIKAFALYRPDGYYCNFTFEKLNSQPGNKNVKITEHQKELMTKAAEVVLSREFTIPKNVIYAMGDDNNQNLKGVIYYGKIDGTDQKFGTGGKDFATTDVYGNTVSTDPDWYINRATILYNKYFK